MEKSRSESDLGFCASRAEVTCGGKRFTRGLLKENGNQRERYLMSKYHVEYRNLHVLVKITVKLVFIEAHKNGGVAELFRVSTVCFKVLLPSLAFGS